MGMNINIIKKNDKKEPNITKSNIVLSRNNKIPYKNVFKGVNIKKNLIIEDKIKNVCFPYMKQKHSMIIFDWDDTLLPTSFLYSESILKEEVKFNEIENQQIFELENYVCLLLYKAVEKGDVYIITNSGNGWVELTAKRFYPSILPILERITIISAREQYEKIYPDNRRQWKIDAFLHLHNLVNTNLINNIICIGDSMLEIEAGKILASKFKEAFIKNIKFQEAPKLDELLKQLKLVYNKFECIYSKRENLTIKLEKIKKF